MHIYALMCICRKVELETLKIEYKVSLFYYEAGKLDESSFHLKTLSKYLEKDETELGVQVNILKAHLLRREGKTTQAIEAYRKLLEVKRLNPSHKINILQGLGNAYQNENPELAIHFYEEVLAQQKEFLKDENHFEILKTLNNLANNYAKMGEPEKAISLHEMICQKREATLGPDHVYTIDSLASLAFAYYQCGSFSRSEMLYSQVASDYERLFGKDSEKVYLARNGEGRAMKMVGDLDRAEEHFRTWYALAQQHMVENQRYSLLIGNNLASTLIQNGKNEEAAEIMTAVLAKSESIFGPQNSDSLHFRFLLAKALLNHNHAEALIHFEKHRQYTLEMGRQLKPVQKAYLGFAQFLAGKHEKGRHYLDQGYNAAEDPEDRQEVVYLYHQLKIPLPHKVQQ